MSPGVKFPVSAGIWVLHSFMCLESLVQAVWGSEGDLLAGWVSAPVPVAFSLSFP